MLKDSLGHTTRDKILELLKINGEMTVASLSKELGVSGVNVRGHLSRLERDGFVCMRVDTEKVHERGRPSYLYRLTDKGHELFPSAYNHLASEVLHQVKRLFGIQAVREIFLGRAEQFLAELQERLKGKTLEVTKVSELAELLRKLGYVVEVEAIGVNEYMLTIKHCPISQIAADFPEVCAAELNMQRQALDAKVKLKRQIPRGGPYCYYRIHFKQ
ncbi:MAG: ArsR family transcriptional regulator [Acidobacteriota bacterium]|nr:ArsR family transcriptional regulator [Blastocatellia bacterium]MDW8413467.1 ArsR family transcriptional regulator [Acidobacteriota bacterium]